MTQHRVDISRKSEFTAFMAWISGHHRQGAGGIAERTFRHRIRWCWNVRPNAVVTGQVLPQIMLDGTSFNGWCVLVAYTGTHVVDWQWTDREKHASWAALLQRIPAPDIAIIDGHQSIRSALEESWPHTKVQRCLFHIRQGAHRHLTRNPVLPASKELLTLIKALSNVKTLDQAAAWTGQYASWEAQWSTFMKKRTYANQRGATRPTYVQPNQKWWYTHLRLRRAKHLIGTIVKSGHLFTWIEHSTKEQNIDRTTSPLEGGINAGIKELLRNHRGLSEAHARRAIDWYLYQRTQTPQEPWNLVKPTHWQPPRSTPRKTIPEPDGPALYDNALSYQDGNGIQQGWAGRRP